MTNTMQSRYAPGGMPAETADTVARVAGTRLVDLADLAHSLKHAHWNVIGPGFHDVHELFDELHAGVRAMTDEMAERIATLGAIPNALPAKIVETRATEDYPIGRAVAEAHLAAIDSGYDSVIAGHRAALETMAENDPVTEDLVISQLRQLEQQQWFVRAHIETTSGRLPEGDDTVDRAAAAAVQDPRD